MATDILPPVHPGEILHAEFLVPLKMSAGASAKQLGVPRTRIERLVGQKTPVTTDKALRLAKFFRTTSQFWLTMQTSHDLKLEAEAKKEELALIPEMEAA